MKVEEQLAPTPSLGSVGTALTAAAGGLAAAVGGWVAAVAARSGESVGELSATGGTLLALAPLTAAASVGAVAFAAHPCAPALTGEEAAAVVPLLLLSTLPLISTTAP